MRMLWRRQKINCSRLSLQLRYFVAIPSAMVERPTPKQLVWVRIRATHVPVLQLVLQSCARSRAAIEGMTCHGQIIRVGIGADTVTSNMLMNMYSKCGLVDSARKVFDEMPVRCSISWNTIIGSHTQVGESEKALGLLMQMQKERTSVSEFTVSSVVCACAAKCCVFECKQLHGFALKTALDSSLFVGTALLGVYGKCGLVKDASLVFESMPERNDVTWSSMVAGYVQNKLYEEALVLFQRAQAMGLEHNQFTISSALSACAARAALIEGNQVHAVLCKTGIGSNTFVVSSLVDMYAKCGRIEDAYIVFSSVDEKNVVLWNAMLSGFSRHVRYLEAMILFEKMQQMGICPNEITYVSVLSACSHLGLVEKGQKYFDLMIREHNVSPNVLHYSCMADILGRAGLLHEAKDLIDRMPFEATPSIWGSLLASCRIYRNLELGEVAAKHLVEIEPHNAVNHMLLSDLYAAKHRCEEVSWARKHLKQSKAKKERGKSRIEINHQVHSFLVGERNHHRIVRFI